MRLSANQIGPISKALAEPRRMQYITWETLLVSGVAVATSS